MKRNPQAKRRMLVSCIVLISMLFSTIAFATPISGELPSAKTHLAERVDRNSINLATMVDVDIPGIPIPASGFSGTLDEVTDAIHVYSVELTAGQRFVVNMSGDEDTDFDLSLYGSDALSIYDDFPVALSWGETSNEILSYYASKSGTYYLVVEAFYGSGEYTITYDYIDTPQFSRIFGSTRYETAVEVSREGWHSSPIVFLARGDDYADALTSVPMAYLYDAPILLTRPNELHQSTRAEIERLGAVMVFIVGGEGAISAEVEDELWDMEIIAIRIAGKNRIETAAKIAEEVVLVTDADTAVIVYSGNFPDALAAASYAAREGYPILLTGTHSVPAATLDAIDDLDINNTIVVGGTGVISESAAGQLPNAFRVGGTNRYTTAVALAEYFGSESSRVYVTTGLNFADAATSAVLAAKQGTGLLLVGEDVSFEVIDYIIEEDVAGFTIIGGLKAVSEEIETILIFIIDLL